MTISITSCRLGRQRTKDRSLWALATDGAVYRLNKRLTTPEALFAAAALEMRGHIDTRGWTLVRSPNVPIQAELDLAPEAA